MSDLYAQQVNGYINLIGTLAELGLPGEIITDRIIVLNIPEKLVDKVEPLTWCIKDGEFMEYTPPEPDDVPEPEEPSIEEKILAKLDEIGSKVDSAIDQGHVIDAMLGVM